MMKKSVFVMLAAAAMVSCTESNLNDAPGVDNGEIKVKSVAYDVNAATRTPFEGALSNTNALTARVITSVDAAFTSGSHSDGTMVFNTANAVQYFSLNSGDSKYPSGALHLFGLHPATGWSNGTTDTEHTFTFTGKEDVMAAAMVESKNQTDVKMLTFKHLLTRLDVKLKADAAAVTAFGNISRISLAKGLTSADVCNTITYDAAGAGTVTLGAENATINFSAMSADASGNKTYTDDAFVSVAIPLPTVETYFAYAMVAPVEDIALGDELYYLVFETEHKGTQHVGVKLEKALLGSSAGYAYEVTVNFKSTGQIEASASVIPWKEGGNASGEIEDN